MLCIQTIIQFCRSSSERGAGEIGPPAEIIRKPRNERLKAFLERFHRNTV